MEMAARHFSCAAGIKDAPATRWQRVRPIPILYLNTRGVFLSSSFFKISCGFSAGDYVWLEAVAFCITDPVEYGSFYFTVYAYVIDICR